MNSTKLAYVRNRALEIKKAKLAEITEKYRTPAKTLSGVAKIAALKSGEYTIDENRISDGYYWYNAIKFNGEQIAALDVVKINKEKAVVETKFTKLMDELMLGDDEEAIKLLREFEAL